MLRKISLFFLLCTGAAGAAAQERIELWPEGPMPNSRGIAVTDSIANHRVYRVGRPAMYRVAPTAPNRGIAVVICPGGGYQRYAWEVAGFDIADWLAAQGITGFVLTARLPLSPDAVDPSVIGTQDLQRALRIIRARHAEWGIDPAKIGVEGSSAGGHLAASAAVADGPLYEALDAVDNESCAVDFMVLVSPVITLEEPFAHRGSRETLLGTDAPAEHIARHSLHYRVTAATPPTLLVHANDDRTVPAENSLLFCSAMRQAGAPVTLHLFQRGGHSISLEEQPYETQLWSRIVERWIDGLFEEAPEE